MLLGYSHSCKNLAKKMNSSGFLRTAISFKCDFILSDFDTI